MCYSYFLSYPSPRLMLSFWFLLTQFAISVLIPCKCFTSSVMPTHLLSPAPTNTSHLKYPQVLHVPQRPPSCCFLLSRSNINVLHQALSVLSEASCFTTLPYCSSELGLCHAWISCVSLS